MPKVSVTLPHNMDAKSVQEKAGPIIEKTIKDFEGHDLQLTWTGQKAEFRFKSLGFSIQGHVAIDDQNITVEINLPIAAIMFKDRVEKGIRKNLGRALGVVPES